MRYLIFDNMNECTEQAVTNMLPLVSPQRQEQALKFRHVFGQFACLKSFVMLSELMQWTAQEITQVEFIYNEHGKPLLPNEWKNRMATPHFSISHCKQAIAVAVCESPIGVDVESIRNVDAALIERTMNSQEQMYIHASCNPAAAFTELWTRKESFLKYKGTGIVDSLQDTLTHIPDNVKQQIYKKPNYILTITS